MKLLIKLRVYHIYHFLSLFLCITTSLFIHTITQKNRPPAIHKSTFKSTNTCRPTDAPLLLRSQSFHGTRKVSGELPGSEHIFISDIDEWNSFVSITLAGQKTMDNDTIIHNLFGGPYLKKPYATKNNFCRPYLKIQGSRLVDRDPYALRADDLYLSDEFNGTLSFNPTISHFLADFNLYIGFDELVHGLYCRLYTTFAHTRSNLHAHEKIISTNTQSVHAVTGGRFSPEPLSRDNVFDSALDFFSGNMPNNRLNPPQTMVQEDRAQSPFTLIRDSLSHHKIIGSVNQNNVCLNTCNSSMTTNGFAEVRAELGWNFLHYSDYHLGFYLTGAAPTGSRPSSDFLFSPVIGNYKHWEVGAGLTAHWLLWESPHENQHMGIYTDMVATHLFKAKESLVFDLKDKPLSRYMLASKYIAVHNGGPNQVSSTLQQEIDSINTPTPVSFLSLGEFTPLANLTAQNVSVSVNAQTDITAWINYTFYGLSMDIGYNFWFSTGRNSKPSILCDSRLASETTWALHGDAQTFGYFPLSNSEDHPGSPDNPSPTSASQAIIMAATESKATVATGTDMLAATPLLNYGVDNAQYALANDDQVDAKYLVNFAHKEQLFNPEHQIKLSATPLFLTPEDIAIPKNNYAFSHTVFGSIGYTADCEGMAPYFGIGGESEFGSGAAVSQWSVWAKCILSFN